MVGVQLVLAIGLQKERRKGNPDKEEKGQQVLLIFEDGRRIVTYVWICRSSCRS